MGASGPSNMQIRDLIGRLACDRFKCLNNSPCFSSGDVKWRQEAKSITHRTIRQAARHVRWVVVVVEVMVVGGGGGDGGRGHGVAW